jgi:hypothetical protein
MSNIYFNHGALVELARFGVYLGSSCRALMAWTAQFSSEKKLLAVPSGPSPKVVLPAKVLADLPGTFLTTFFTGFLTTFLTTCRERKEAVKLS